MPFLSELIAELEADLATKPRRYPVVRSGDRDPIPSVVRLSIYRRDGFHCRLCGALCEWSTVELDHLMPWSAGGSDASDNLRALCGPCNQRRSNWDDGDGDVKARPTTWWCWECWRHPDLDPAEPDYLDEMPPQRQFRKLWRDGTNLNRVPWVTSPEIQVYCAWCWAYSYSDHAFVAGQQDALAAMCVVDINIDWKAGA